MHNKASCMYRHRPAHAARFSIYQSTFKPLCRAASACHPGSIGKYASLHADEVVPLAALGILLHPALRLEAEILEVYRKCILHDESPYTIGS